MSRKQPVSLAGRVLREVRKAEADARADNVQDVGTGFTIIRLKRHQPPLATLVGGKKISGPELAAAAEIELAAFSLHLRGHLAAVDLQRIDHGRQGDSPLPHHIAMAVRNYRSWQKHWTEERRLTGCPMLEVIYSAVVDERPMSVIAADMGIGRKRTQRAIIAGLRHYAAWTNLVVGIQRQAWIAAAQQVFDRRLAPTSN